MKLTTPAQQSMDFSQACFLQGLCTTKEYMNAIKRIYQDDLNKQICFLIDQGLTEKQAFENIYGLGKERIL